MKPCLCVDIDNVIACTDEVMREVIRRCSKDQVDLRYEDVVEFDYWRCVDLHGRSFDKTEWQHIHDEFTRNYLHKVKPFDDIRSHLHELDKQFEIHVVTSRLPEGHNATRDWLSAHQIPFSQLHFTSHRKKHLLTQPFVAAIEDDRDQVELFQEQGVRSFLLAHPWNKIEPNSKVTRITKWSELVVRVLAVCP